MQAALGHSYGTEWKSDGTNHWHECSCGAKKDTASHTPGDEATHTTAQICTECGHELQAALGHSYGTEWKSDGTNHWHECSCGAKKDVGAHSGGTATCEAKAKCSDCNVEYGEFAAHTPVADDNDCTTDITCSICGGVTTEGANAHTGGTATCESKAKCAACGKEYGELAEHKYNEATCEKKATCSVCGTETGAFVAHADNDNNGTCDVCDYTMSVVDPETDPETDPADDNDGLGTGAIVAIVVVATIVLAGGGFVFYWFVIKKKKY